MGTNAEYRERCVAAGLRLADHYGWPHEGGMMAADIQTFVDRTGLEPEVIEKVLAEISWQFIVEPDQDDSD